MVRRKRIIQMASFFLAQISLFFRISQDDRDNRVERDDEFSDSEDEGDGGRRNQDDFSQQGNNTAKGRLETFFENILISRRISNGTYKYQS